MTLACITLGLDKHYAQCEQTKLFHGKLIPQEKHMKQSQRAASIDSSKRGQGMSVFIMCAVLMGMPGCSWFKQPKPATLGETMSGYTYIPIDPTKVYIEPKACAIDFSSITDDVGTKNHKLLDMLPDNAVRMSMELSDAKGNVTYGVSKVGASGLAYRLTADYVNSDTVNKAVWIRRSMLRHATETTYDQNGKVARREEQTNRVPVSISEGSLNEKGSLTMHAPSSDKGGGSRDEESRVIPGTDLYEVRSFENTPGKEERESLGKDQYQEFNVPIYVGIGLRIVAEGSSSSSEANISGIGVIGVEAEAKRLVGSLTVQTLGVNSQAVASALPVQSELSRVTAENAFVAIGAIKAMLHQKETLKFPRVVGLYLPFPGGKPLVNALISELSSKPVSWCPAGYSRNGLSLR